MRESAGNRRNLDEKEKEREREEIKEEIDKNRTNKKIQEIEIQNISRISIN